VFIFIGGEYLSKRFKPNIIYENGHNYLRLDEVKTTKNVDILFLGSSHTYRGFDTRIFKEAGYKVFNMGSSSQTPAQTLVLLKRYLNQLSPKLVVFEVFPNIFTIDGVESTLDLISNDNNDLHSLKMVIEQKNMKVLNTYLYALHKEIIGFIPSYKFNTYHQGGYVSQKHLSYNTDMRSLRTKLDIKDKQIKSLEIIVELLQSKNITYMLVQAPLTSNLYKSYTNIDEFNSKMDSYGTYFDFNDRLKLNDSLDFYDRHHLNQNGVSIFNINFLKLLENNYSSILHNKVK
jgi:hypothetical protein